MLEEQRKKIDCLDQKIVNLLEERMDVVRNIATIKAENELSVLDSSREKEVLNKVSSYVKHPEYQVPIVKLYEEIMSLSREFQTKQL